MLGVLGGLAAATEALNQLFRWRDSSIEAFQGANSLEALLNLYVTSSGPYADDKVADEKFVVDAEAVRRDKYGGIVSLWSDTKTPSKRGAFPPGSLLGTGLVVDPGRREAARITAPLSAQAVEHESDGAVCIAS